MKRIWCMFVMAVLVVSCGGAVFGQDKAVQPEGVQKKAKPAIVSLKKQTVVSVNAESNILTVKDKDGNEQAITLTDKTKIKRGKAKLKLSDLATGESVTVYFKKSKGGNSEPSSVIAAKQKKQ